MRHKYHLNCQTQEKDPDELMNITVIKTIQYWNQDLMSVSAPPRKGSQVFNVFIIRQTADDQHSVSLPLGFYYFF